MAMIPPVVRRIGLIGTYYSGTTQLILHYLHLDPDSYEPTIYDDTYSKFFMINGFPATLQITFYRCDNDNISRVNLYRSSIIFLCYSMADRHSFDQCRNTYHSSLERAESPIFLVATHSESLQDYSREVLQVDGRALCDELHFAGYYEVSVANNEGVTELFDAAIRVIYKDRMDELIASDKQKSTCRVS